MMLFLRMLLLAVMMLCFTEVLIAQAILSEELPALLDEELPEIDAPMEYESYSEFTNRKLALPVTIAVTRTNLRDVLAKLSRSSQIEFVFDDNLVNIRGVNLSVQNKVLKEVLDELLPSRGIDYVVASNGRVILAKQERVQESIGTIKGVVRDKAGELLPGANVVIKGTRVGCSTSVDGAYIIAKLKPGVYMLEVSYVGCAAVRKEVVVRPGETSVADFVLDQPSFMIGAIECVGNTELLPKDANTKTVISSAVIEHYQASSVGDVLDLVPGIQKTANPGLSKTSQIAVRGDQDDNLSAFGTLVMVDGIPLSNNANLQFEKYTSSTTGVSNRLGGADLRTIPADNIQSIEVVSGVPSVRYGDVTSGIINVQTKIGRQPHRVKFKSNPDTWEGNLGGGIMFDSTGVSYNLNVARSERDLRKDGDEFTRLTGQVVLTNTLFDGAVTMNNKLYGQRLFDEEKPKGDVWQTHNYNRGYTLTYSLWGKYIPPDEVSNWEYNTYVTYRKENSMRSKLVQSDIRILPSGDTISTYVGKVETRGEEWTLGGRLEWNQLFYTGDLIHRFTVGSDVQYNANTGEGVLVDTLFNYYGSTSGRSSYKFDDIPGQLLWSLYAEDKFTGTLGCDYNLSFGVRYEMYRPLSFNIKGLWGDGDLVRSRQGSYFNPRMNLLVYLSDVNQVRLSAGFSSKSPSMSSIYPEPDVLRWRNPFENRIVHFRPDLRSLDLKGYREGQVELAYDHKLFGNIGTSFSGYYKKRNNEPRSVDNPIFAIASVGQNSQAYFVDRYSKYANVGWTETKGLEFAFRTNQIRPLNMEFQLVGSYSFIKRGSNALLFDETPDASRGEFPNYRVPDMPYDTLVGLVYPSSYRWDDRLILNYYVKYTVPPLGLWITLRAEQLVFERYQSYSAKPLDYSLLSPAALLEQQFQESMRPRYVKWLFNLNISKSLFKGGEVSFYVNNFLDDPAIGRYNTTATTYSDNVRNPDLFYGIEFSLSVDELLK